jgi:hypothetical protein
MAAGTKRRALQTGTDRRHSLHRKLAEGLMVAPIRDDESG